MYDLFVTKLKDINYTNLSASDQHKFELKRSTDIDI